MGNEMTNGASGNPGAEVTESGASVTEIDRIVIRRVFERCHKFIAEAISGCQVPAAFVGALAANESGGLTDAMHFEAWVYRRLKAVANGRAPAFGSIARKQLLRSLGENSAPADAVISGDADRKLREFATSWGFTQIMGYHVIHRSLDIGSLTEPAAHFHIAVELLSEFARRFDLRLARDFEQLFRCWNTGRPDGTTFNPNYVAAGIRRMALYHELANNAQEPQPLSGRGCS